MSLEGWLVMTYRVGLSLLGEGWSSINLKTNSNNPPSRSKMPAGRSGACKGFQSSDVGDLGSS